MSLPSLKCRGLGHPSAVNTLWDLIQREAPSLVFLPETKLSISEFNKIRGRRGDFYSLVVDSVGISGGLALMWRKYVDVVL